MPFGPASSGHAAAVIPVMPRQLGCGQGKGNGPYLLSQLRPDLRPDHRALANLMALT